MTTLAPGRAALRRLADGGWEEQGDVSPLIRRGTRVLLLLLWIIGAVTALASGWLLLHHAQAHTESVAMSVEQYARRTVTLASFVENEYENYLDQRGGLAGLADDPAATQRLRSLSEWLPRGSVIGVASPEGRWLASSIDQQAPSAPITDRRWFQAHVKNGLQSYIGPAILSRLSNRYVFTYSTSYRGADGRLLAIISIGIPSDSVTDLSPDQHHTSTALVQHEGAVVAANPFEPGMVGRTLALPGPVTAGEASGSAPVFGGWSVFVVRDIPEFDLHAIAAVPVFDVFGPLYLGLAIGLPLLLLLTFLLLVLSDQLQNKSQQVEQALADNRVLFQEVHHRVKNNLQVVSSLLRLQTERLPPELRPLLEETGARVRAIALVHEQIYRTASPSDVQLDRFLAQLVQQLSASMLGGTAKITTELEPVTIGLDRAVPVAILATEAITNAIKHGLDKGEGTINVSLASRDGRNLIVVRNSGGGPPDDGQPGLGTRIMTALARQIDGEWTLGASPDGGTLYRLAWPA